MGLDTSHDAWHGAYSSFYGWRLKLAEVAGYTVSKPDGSHNDIVELDWGSIHKVIGRDLMGKWDKIPVRHDGTPDPLIILLAHSDCDGELQHEFLYAIADRLAELLPKLDGHYFDDAQKFIKGLRKAAAAEENVEFH